MYCKQRKTLIYVYSSPRSSPFPVLFHNILNCDRPPFYEYCYFPLWILLFKMLWQVSFVLSASHSSPITFFFLLPFKDYCFLYVPPGLTFKNSTCCSLCFECFLRISEQTATFALYLIYWLVFIIVLESVYNAARTESLYKAYYV